MVLPLQSCNESDEKVFSAVVSWSIAAHIQRFVAKVREGPCEIASNRTAFGPSSTQQQISVRRASERGKWMRHQWRIELFAVRCICAIGPAVEGLRMSQTGDPKKLLRQPITQA